MSALLRSGAALVGAVSLGIFGAELFAAATGAQPAAGLGVVTVVAVFVCCMCAGAWWRLTPERAQRADVGSAISVAELCAQHGDHAALRATVAAVGDALDRTPTSSAVPLAVHVGDDVIEVFWDRPPPVATPTFRAANTGWVWTTTPAQLLPHLARDDTPESAPLLPMLVAAGATGLGELYLNLEGCRLLNLVGEAAHAQRALEHLLASVPMALVDVLVVGAISPPGVVGTPDPVSLESALVEARRRRAGFRRDLEERTWTSVLGARRRDASGERWRPLLIAVADVSGDPESLGRLARAARGDRSGVGCVFVNRDPDAESVAVACGDGVLHLPFLGGVAAVLPDARDNESTASGDDKQVVVRPEPLVAAAAVASPSAVEVRLLGPVEIVGMRSPLGGKSVELVAYLACHRAGVSDDRIKTVLWPERPVTHATWLNRVSASRHALGTNADGEPVLPYFEDGIGCLASSVVTDVQILEAALRDTNEQSDVEAMEVLQAALGRVRGHPFDERAGYEWAFAELHVAHAERIVAEVAQRLAALALAAGDWATARWASEQGLLAVPASEPLARDRMRAFAAGGDPRGVQRALRDLLAGIGGDDPTSALDPETRELYELLTMPARAPSGW